MDQPEELGGSEQMIAQIKTVSEMTTSLWGDEHLYFRHTRMEDDLALRPEWEPSTPLWPEDERSGCPFADLLQFLE